MFGNVKDQNIKFAPVVQRIGRMATDHKMRVRFLLGVLRNEALPNEALDFTGSKF